MSNTKSGFNPGKSRHSQLWDGVGPIGIAASGNIGPKKKTGSGFFAGIFSSSEVTGDPTSPIDITITSNSGDMVVVSVIAVSSVAPFTVTNISDDVGNLYTIQDQISFSDGAAIPSFRTICIALCEVVNAPPAKITTTFSGASSGDSASIGFQDWTNGQGFLVPVFVSISTPAFHFEVSSITNAPFTTIINDLPLSIWTGALGSSVTYPPDWFPDQGNIHYNPIGTPETENASINPGSAGQVAGLIGIVIQVDKL